MLHDPSRTHTKGNPMNVFIAGGGRVGYHLARLLSSEHQNVTVIESDRDALEQIDYALDVSTVAGDGSNAMLLQSIGVGTATLFVSSMGNDEKNLIAAATAKGLGAQTTVARVGNPMYVESNVIYEPVLGIDYILSPDALTALEIAHFVEEPGLLASESFGHGLVQMRQIVASKTPTIGGKTLKDAIAPGSGVLVGVIVRDDKTMIPNGSSVIHPGDKVVLVGHRDKITKVSRLFHDGDAKHSRVAIMGGGTIGMRVAQTLDGRIKSVKLFERREERADALAPKLRHAKVVCRDGSSRVSLEQEHIDAVDVFIAATNDDERNIMASVLAKDLGAKQAVAVINQPDFAPLVKRLGIDLAVTPRAAIANRILKLAHQGDVSSLAIIDEGDVEVLEFAASGASSLLDRPLKEAAAKLPKGTLVATIVRGDNVIVPSGEDQIHAGDSVILICYADTLESVRKIFAK